MGAGNSTNVVPMKMKIEKKNTIIIDEKNDKKNQTAELVIFVRN